MWFEGRSPGGRRRKPGARNRRQAPTLSVSARGRGRGRAQPAEFGRFLVWPAGVVLVLALAWLGGMGLWALLFSHNDRFLLRRLEIMTDDTVALDYIREKQAIREGINLFSFSVRTIRRDFLRAAPNYRSMEITRLLPDGLRIRVAPRDPIARMGSRGGFAVDAEKRVFGFRAGNEMLPSLIGYPGPMLKPGDRLSGMAADAIDVLAMAAEVDAGGEIPVEGIDVTGNFAGKADDLRLYLANRTVVDLWWPRHRGSAEEAREQLRDRLMHLRGVIREAEQRGRRLKSVNVTLDSYRTNIPVEYWN